MLVAGGALVGIGVASVKMAADFQQATLSLVAHAGLATDQINNVSRAVLAMAPTVGRSPTELAEALYPILSAFSGITNQSAKTTLSLSTLKMAFETVAGTTVDGTAVANAAVGTFNALGLATNNAGTNAQRMTNLFDVMDKTVQLGNMTWDQYKNVIAKVATSSNTAHVSFDEASAALATLTSQGMNVQKAGTYLVNTFNTLEIKTDLLAARAKKLHISFDESKYSSMDLADKIKYLNEVTDGNSQKLLALMGNNSTALLTFEKLSTGVNTYRSDLDALNHSQGALNASFDTAAEGFNFHAQQLKAAFDVLFINIGTQLLPILGKLADQITPLIMSFADWIDKNNAITNGFNTLVGIVQNSVNWYNQWKGVIQNTGIALAVFFTPALIKAGVEAVVSAYNIAFKFVLSLIATGAEGWAAAGKLAVFIASLIATGAQAVISAARVTISFIASLIATASEAYAAAFAVTGSFVPALGIVGIQAVSAGGKLAVNFVQGLVAARTASVATAATISTTATPAIAGAGTAATVAAGPIIALGAIFAATAILIANKAYIMDKNVQTDTGEMVTAQQLRFHQMASGANISATEMKNGVSNSANDMKNNVVQSFSNMAQQTYSDTSTLSQNALQNFQNLNGDLTSQMSTIDANVIGYWNDIANWIASHEIVGHVTYTTAGGGIGVQQSATTAHNAEGTDNWRGGWSWVGEKGPELMNIPRGAQIIPHDRSVAAASGGGQPVQINIHLAGHRVAQTLLPDIVQAVRSHTGVRF